MPFPGGWQPRFELAHPRLRGFEDPTDRNLAIYLGTFCILRSPVVLEQKHIAPKIAVDIKVTDSTTTWLLGCSATGFSHPPFAKTERSQYTQR